MKKLVKLLALVLASTILFSSFGVQAANVKNNAVKSAYQIQVNRIANCVTVYKLDSLGNYNPVRSFACSVGKDIENTPLGTFKTSDYYDWRLMVDGSYGQYAVRFNRGILFHSVPYLASTPDSLEADQFNLLGTNASLGCVRLCASDVKWIYDNCPKGTEVIVYDDATNPGPLGKPTVMKTFEGNPLSGWDPTDERVENPWNLIRPTQYLKLDFADNVLYVFQGSTPEDLKNYIGCKDYLGNDLFPEQYTVSINGNYNMNTVGVYRVWISVIDTTGIVNQKEYVMAVVPATQQ